MTSKKIQIGLSVVFGMLLAINISTAVANNPTVAPPGGNVDANFTSVNALQTVSAEDIEVRGTMSGDLGSDGGGDVFFMYGLQVNSGESIRFGSESLQNSLTGTGTNLNIGALNITTGGSLSVADDLDVTGSLNVSGDFSLDGYISSRGIGSITTYEKTETVSDGDYKLMICPQEPTVRLISCDTSTNTDGAIDYVGTRKSGNACVSKFDLNTGFSSAEVVMSATCFDSSR